MAATTPITSLLPGTVFASSDVLVFVDVSDHTQSPQGSTLKATLTSFFAGIPVPVVVTSASANALAVGLTGATNPAFAVDASTALQVAGLKVTGAVTGGTVAVQVTDSGSNANLSIGAKGAGTVTVVGPTIITGGSITANTNPALSLTQTWNSGAVTFTGIKLNITNTASAVLSKLMDLQVGSVSQFQVSRTANLQIGTAGTLAGNSAISVEHNALTGTGQYGIYSSPVGSSAATDAVYAIYALPQTAAAAFTCTTMAGVYVATPVKGAGSTITTAYGVYIDSQTVGGTNYALYTNGTAASRFGGAVAIVGALTQTALATFNGGATVASGQTLTVTGATITGLTAASVGAGTFPSGAYVFAGALSGITSLGATSVAITGGGVFATSSGNLRIGAGSGSGVSGTGSLDVTTDIGITIGNGIVANSARVMAFNANDITIGAAVNLITAATSTARAGLNVPHGTAPTSPVNGDFWTTTSGAFIRINGVTKTFTLT